MEIYLELLTETLVLQVNFKSRVFLLNTPSIKKNPKRVLT